MQLAPLSFETLAGWSEGEAADVWPAFRTSCRAILENLPPLRVGTAPDPALRRVCARAMEVAENDPATIERFFRAHLTPHLVGSPTSQPEGFVTGYYEPEIAGSLVETRRFGAPVLSRPSDLVDMRGVRAIGWDPRLEGARRLPDGRREAYPDRAAIEAGDSHDARPVVWLEDLVEVFYAQVQGSARIILPDGSRRRLVYDGRNGRPYASIGRILLEAEEISRERMSLAACKNWLRAHGLGVGQRGRQVLQRNESYVFFRLDVESDPAAGPIGAQGMRLTALRSIAVDREIWPYGLPVWIEADLTDAGLGGPPGGRLMIAQDTGSAIVGPARGDLFTGTGPRAGEIAGEIRHSARFIVLLPKNS